jgi:hypothetical protein
MLFFLLFLAAAARAGAVVPLVDYAPSNCTLATVTDAAWAASALFCVNGTCASEDPLTAPVIVAGARVMATLRGTALSDRVTSTATCSAMGAWGSRRIIDFFEFFMRVVCITLLCNSAPAPFPFWALCFYLPTAAAPSLALTTCDELLASGYLPLPRTWDSCNVTNDRGLRFLFLSFRNQFVGFVVGYVFATAHSLSNFVNQTVGSVCPGRFL